MGCASSKSPSSGNLTSSQRGLVRNVHPPYVDSTQQSHTAGMPSYNCLKFTYDVAAEKWNREHTTVRIAANTFSQGGMRVCFRADELEQSDRMPSVIKVFKPQILGMAQQLQQHQLLQQQVQRRQGARAPPPVDTAEAAIYFDEAMTQMVADSYAQDFNRRCAQKGLPNRVAFLPVSVLQFSTVSHIQQCYNSYDQAPTSMASFLALLEPYLPGQYMKHSDNTGNHNEMYSNNSNSSTFHSDNSTPPQTQTQNNHNPVDETAFSFSYFSYIASNQLLVVCE